MILSISSAQLNEAKSNPSLFLDGVVVERHSGLIAIQLLSDDSVIKLRVFEAPVDCSAFQLFEPVAYHVGAELLANIDIWISAKLDSTDNSTGYNREGLI